MTKPIFIKPKKQLKIVVQTRIPIETCNIIDKFAEKKRISRSESLGHLLKAAAELIQVGQIQ